MNAIKRISSQLLQSSTQLWPSTPRSLITTSATLSSSSKPDNLMGWQQTAKDFDPKQVAFFYNDLLIKVDENDSVIGSISKGESHAIDTVQKGIYHRAFSLLIFDEQDRFLLTQRAACKITFPNYYTNACCSHPLYEPSEIEHEDAIGAKRAAIRRSNFELGINLADIGLDELKFVNRLAYRAISDGGLWGEAEIDYIFILRKNFKLDPNPDEVQRVRYVTKDEMRELLKKQHDIKVTPWVKLLARDHLFNYWDNLHQLDKMAEPEIIVYHEDLLPTH